MWHYNCLCALEWLTRLMHNNFPLPIQLHRKLICVNEMKEVKKNRYYRFIYREIKQVALLLQRGRAMLCVRQ